MTNCQLPDAGTRGWIFNTARTNFWRVASWYTFEDLVQDGYLCYAKCYNRYYHTLEKDHARQMMALTQSAFLNHIHTLARKHSLKEVPASQLVREDDTEDSALERLTPPQEEEATILTVLSNAPAEIKQLITLLLTDVTGFARKQVSRRQLRETTNEYWCRLLNLDPTTNDLRSKVEAFFNR